MYILTFNAEPGRKREYYMETIGDDQHIRTPNREEAHEFQDQKEARTFADIKFIVKPHVIPA